MNQKSKSKNKKIIIIALITIVVVVIAVVGFLSWRRAHNSVKTNNDPNGDSLGYVNYGPPTEQEKQEAETNKDAVVDRQKLEQQAANDPTSGGTKKQVIPQISSANQTGQDVLITAYVGGVFEGGGTCTLVAQNGSQKITRTSEGFADATTTSCTPFRMTRNEFPAAGNWTVTIQYSSKTAEGISSGRQLVIQ